MATLRFECITTVIKYNLIKRNRLWNTGLVFLAAVLGVYYWFFAMNFPGKNTFKRKWKRSG